MKVVRQYRDASTERYYKAWANGDEDKVPYGSSLPPKDCWSPMTTEGWVDLTRINGSHHHLLRAQRQDVHRSSNCLNTAYSLAMTLSGYPTVAMPLKKPVTPETAKANVERSFGSPTARWKGFSDESLMNDYVHSWGPNKHGVVISQTKGQGHIYNVVTDSQATPHYLDPQSGTFQSPDSLFNFETKKHSVFCCGESKAPVLVQSAQMNGLVTEHLVD